MNMETGSGGNDELGGRSPYNYGAQHSMDSGSGPQGEITPPYTGSEIGAEPDAVPASEPEAVPAFGPQRFEGTEPYFDGTPPPEYLDATVRKFDNVVLGNINMRGVLSAYDLFTDRHRELVVNNDGRSRWSVSERTVLQHQMAEGTIDMVLQSRETTLRWTDKEGSVTAQQRYYLTRSRDELSGELYTVLRKGSGKALNGFLAGTAEQNTDPLVGVDEAACVIDEYIANGKPPAVPCSEVIDAIRREAEAGSFPFANDVQATASTFALTVAEHRNEHVMPEDFMNDDPGIIERRINPNGTEIGIRTEVMSGADGLIGTDRRVAIIQMESVNVAGIQRARELRGLSAPDYDYFITAGTFIDKINVVDSGGKLVCTHTVTLNTGGSAAVPLVTREVTPTVDIIGKLRNFMLVKDEDPSNI